MFFGLPGKYILSYKYNYYNFCRKINKNKNKNLAPHSMNAWGGRKRVKEEAPMTQPRLGGPKARSGHAMTYAPSSGLIFLFGGPSPSSLLQLFIIIVFLFIYLFNYLSRVWPVR
jgi:hypothetical protein